MTTRALSVVHPILWSARNGKSTFESSHNRDLAIHVVDHADFDDEGHCASLNSQSKADAPPATTPRTPGHKLLDSVHSTYCPRRFRLRSALIQHMETCTRSSALEQKCRLHLIDSLRRYRCKGEMRDADSHAAGDLPSTKVGWADAVDDFWWDDPVEQWDVHVQAENDGWVVLDNVASTAQSDVHFGCDGSLSNESLPDGESLVCHTPIRTEGETGRTLLYRCSDITRKSDGQTTSKRSMSLAGLVQHAECNANTCGAEVLKAVDEALQIRFTL